MKIIQSLFIGVAISFVCCKGYSQEDYSGVELEVITKGSYTLAGCDSSYFFLYEIQLINNSNATKKFVAYSCLTCFNFITDSEEVHIYGNNCSSNYTSIIIIEPNQKLVLPLILQVKQDVKNKIPNIKIGFVLLHPDKLKGAELTETINKMKKNNQNILWSKTIPFNLTADNQYIISGIR